MARNNVRPISFFPVQWWVPGHNQRKDAYATLKRDYAAAIKSWRELADTSRKTAFSWRQVAGKVSH